MKKVLMVALEPSGDAIGFRCMQELSRINRSVEFIGVGGERMVGSGLLKESLFPIKETSVMGISEVVSSIPRLKRRLNELVDFASGTLPDAVFTIDSKGFNFRFLDQLSAKLKGDEKDMPFRCHAVAPSVWAFKDKRCLFDPWFEDRVERKDYSKIMDEMFAILPFEPSYFASQCTFVGHPVLEDVLKESCWSEGFTLDSQERVIHSPQSFIEHKEKRPSQWILSTIRNARRKKKAKDDRVNKTIGFFPGSRDQELAWSLRILDDLARRFPEYHFLVSVIGATESIVRDSNLGGNVQIVQNKHEIMELADVAVAVSGTIALELACKGVPSVIMYNANRITSFLAKRLSRVNHVSVPNIMNGGKQFNHLLPEKLFEECTSEEIAFALESIAHEPPPETETAAMMTVLSSLLLWDEVHQRPMKPSRIMAHRINDNLKKTVK